MAIDCDLQRGNADVLPHQVEALLYEPTVPAISAPLAAFM